MNWYEFTRYGAIIPNITETVGDSIRTYPLWVAILLCAAGAAIAYLLGGINTAIIISKYKYHEDIRTYGSGNAGMTNMLRTYGKAAAAFTLLGDMAKTAVSVMIGTILCGEAGAYIAGFFCVIGHSFPCWYGFRGGKGIVVTATLLLCLEPVVFLILFVIFVLLVASTKYLSIGSIIGMMLYPILLNRMYYFLNGTTQGIVPAVVSILNALLVVWLHRENLKRLLSGTENKFSLKNKNKFKKEDASDTEPELDEKAARSKRIHEEAYGDDSDK